MLTRSTPRFRSAVESAERYCREIGLDIVPGVVDEIARLWVRRVAEEMGVTDRVALADAPPDFGRRIADSIVESERHNRLAFRPFGRDAVVYTTAPASGAVCTRCGHPIEAGHQAISVLGPTGRGLAHLNCL